MAHWRDPDARGAGRWDGYRLDIAGLWAQATQLHVASFFTGGPTPTKIRMIRRGQLQASTTIISLVSFDQEQDARVGQNMVLALGYSCRCLPPPPKPAGASPAAAHQKAPICIPDHFAGRGLPISVHIGMYMYIHTSTHAALRTCTRL